MSGKANGKSKHSGLFSGESVQELLNHAKEQIDCMQYDVALEFCQRAMDKDASNLTAIEMTAGMFLETGEPEKAKTHLNRLVQLKPDEGHSKYLSLAQLCQGREAVKHYHKGIEIMKKRLESLNEKSDEKPLLLRELSDAYCSTSEIFTTDLCDESDAEELCVENIEKALAVDPNNPEAYLCKSSYFLIRNRRQEAHEMLQKSMSFWLPQMQAIFAGKPVDVKVDPVDEKVYPIDICVLPYNSRISTVKLLLELEDYQTGSDILEVLLSENDEDVEVWYLSGLVNYFRGEDYKNNARYYLKKALRLNVNSGDEDEELKADITELLSELGPGSAEDDESSDEDKENMNGDSDEVVSDGDEASMET